MAEANPRAVALIMAGGSGTRFWPLSQPSFPKQYLNLLGHRTLIQETVDRIAPLCPASRVFICSAESQAPILREQLPDISGLILEPSARNTAPCLMLSAADLLKRNISDDTVMIVLAADHHIVRGDQFRDDVSRAIKYARETGDLCTLGIVPTSPHTGYGYIEAGGEVSPGVRRVARFVEKPDRARAESFLAQKNFFWNSGMFVWTIRSLVGAFEKFMPDAWRAISSAHTREELVKAYNAVDAVAIDVGVLEKASNIAIVPADIGWSDVGSWNALYEMKNSGPDANALLGGEVKTIDSRRCLVRVDSDRKVALVGCEDLVVVEKDGMLLICRRDKDQLVKQASQAF